MGMKRECDLHGNRHRNFPTWSTALWVLVVSKLRSDRYAKNSLPRGRGPRSGARGATSKLLVPARPYQDRCALSSPLKGKLRSGGDSMSASLVNQMQLLRRNGRADCVSLKVLPQASNTTSVAVSETDLQVK